VFYRVVIGLGNPGEKYKLTRHNAGFRVCEEFAARYKARKWKTQPTYKHCTIDVKGDMLQIIKPTLFMNRSGIAVENLIERSGTKMEQVIVVHDDLDLESGRIKVKVGGGSGGHNGIKSIFDHVQNQGFTRVRIGIGKPGDIEDPSEYVLREPETMEERSEFEHTIMLATDALEMIIFDGATIAMNRYNQRLSAAVQNGENDISDGNSNRCRLCEQGKDS